MQSMTARCSRKRILSVFKLADLGLFHSVLTQIYRVFDCSFYFFGCSKVGHLIPLQNDVGKAMYIVPQDLTFGPWMEHQNM